MNHRDWIRNFCILLVLSSIIVSCSKSDSEEDTTEPTAIILSPEANATYLRGNTLYLSAEFSDDVELKEYRVFITEVLKGWDIPWVPEEEIFPLSRKTATVTDQVLFDKAIPNDIKSTDYNLVVLVVDHALNFTRYEVPLVIK